MVLSDVTLAMGTATPNLAKSRSLRVTTVRPPASAVPAISASRSGAGLGTWRGGTARAAAKSSARIRPENPDKYDHFKPVSNQSTLHWVDPLLLDDAEFHLKHGHHAHGEVSCLLGPDPVRDPWMCALLAELAQSLDAEEISHRFAGRSARFSGSKLISALSSMARRLTRSIGSAEPVKVFGTVV